MRPNIITASIVAYVAAHPGCKRRDILAACNLDADHALPTYALRTGRIHAAGHRGSRRYYPTAEQAAAAHDAVVCESNAREQQRKQKHWHLNNRRRKMLRAMARDGLTLAPDVRITIAPPMRERWAA